MEQISSEFKELKYLKGFGNGFSSEAKQDAIPVDQNSPIKLKYGLFAQQLSGTAFTVKRSENQRTWLYKVRPSVVEGQYQPASYPYKIIESYIQNSPQISFDPNQLRWKPVPSVKQGKVNFVQGLVSLAGAGQPSLKQGVSIYTYSANDSMGHTAFYSADGDFLIVPFKGTLYIKTLMGKLIVKPRQICIIPRGVKFTIDQQEQIKGWACEVFGNHFSLPQLGPIGSNGLASPNDFQYPTAWFEDSKTQWKIINKYVGRMFQAKSSFSPYDVVGWRGNYAPCKYNLLKFNTIGSISFDHPDPSIFTVMTCKSHTEGMASLDFVVFPPRWLVQQHTFKPPYYHRNCMTELMGNIQGQYDAKGEGFGPGCTSLHSCLTPHGPDTQSYSNFLNNPNNSKPVKTNDNGLAFMFQSGYLLKTTKYAIELLERQKNYYKCWEKLSQIKFEA